MADTLSTLQKIRNKVRFLTRSPSESQISTSSIDDYINTFILYDFPLQLRTFRLRTNLTFFTQPYVDIYQENTVNTNDALYNFKEKYVSVHPPIYVSGNEIFFTQSEDQFYRLYPKITVQKEITTGDGSTLTFSGTIDGSSQLIRNTFIISAIDANNMGMAGTDSPTYDGVTGNPAQTGNIVSTFNISNVIGSLNYITRAYTVSFTTAPASGTPVYIQYCLTQANTPQACLYFDNKFILRPVPDKAYAIQVDVMKRPTELLSYDQVPELANWFQFIAYGASKKIFEDRMDPESVLIINPEFEKQRELCISQTYAQQKNERSSTIYTDQTEALVSGWGRGGWF